MYTNYSDPSILLMGVNRHRELLNQCGLNPSAVRDALQGVDNDIYNELVTVTRATEARKGKQVARLQAMIEHLEDEMLFLQELPMQIQDELDRTKEVA